MIKLCILLVEDDPGARELGAYNLRKAGYDVEVAASGEEGIASFSPAKHALVITDLRMPKTSGLAVLAHVKAAAPEVPVIIVTAYGKVETAVEAMKAGAHDFIGKPFNRDHLILTVDKALEHRRLTRELRSLRVKASGVEREIVYASESMRRTLEVADRVADSDATVLITGESGTGKELVARRIHVRSARAEGPFVAISCAAVPANLLESELFGHRKGAFTGAIRERRGKFREAHGGTLLLDEIGELPPELQGKLLRVLQERQVDVVGGDGSIPVDVRVLAATNRDLPRMVERGELREDLYYRLNVVEVNVPPLRERPEDIEPLVRHFVAARSEGRHLEIGDDLLDAMRALPWRGNVRELENACERLVILCRGDRLRAEDLPGPALPGTAGSELLDEWPPLPPEGLSLVDLEKRVIERVLEMQGGNVAQSARYLGVPRHVLTYRLQKYGISRP